MPGENTTASASTQRRRRPSTTLPRTNSNFFSPGAATSTGGRILRANLSAHSHPTTSTPENTTTTLGNS